MTRDVDGEVIRLFKKWWIRSGHKWEGSYPFTNQDNWTGTTVMQFARFLFKEAK